MVYYAVEHVIFNRIKTAVLGEIITKHFDQFLESGKAAEALVKKSLINDKSFAPVASFV